MLSTLCGLCGIPDCTGSATKRVDLIIMNEEAAQHKTPTAAASSSSSSPSSPMLSRVTLDDKTKGQIDSPSPPWSWMKFKLVCQQLCRDACTVLQISGSKSKTFYHVQCSQADDVGNWQDLIIWGLGKPCVTQACLHNHLPKGTSTVQICLGTVRISAFLREFQLSDQLIMRMDRPLVASKSTCVRAHGTGRRPA